VWDGRTYRYPKFQFDDAGWPRPETPALIQLLPRQSDGSNRDAALWLYAPDALLKGKTPSDVFPEDPERVLRIARRRRWCFYSYFVLFIDLWDDLIDLMVKSDCYELRSAHFCRKDAPSGAVDEFPSSPAAFVAGSSLVASTRLPGFKCGTERAASANSSSAIVASDLTAARMTSLLFFRTDALPSLWRASSTTDTSSGGRQIVILTIGSTIYMIISFVTYI